MQCEVPPIADYQWHSELKFFYQEGASHLFPEAWWLPSTEISESYPLDSFYIRDEYIAPIPEAERKDMMLAYHAQLNSADEETRTNAAKAWAKWEYVIFIFPANAPVYWLCYTFVECGRPNYMSILHMSPMLMMINLPSEHGQFLWTYRADTVRDFCQCLCTNWEPLFR